VLRLPKPSQPDWMSVPVLVGASVCLLLIGLPIGGEATTARSAELANAKAKRAELVYAPVATEFVEPVDLAIPAKRPTSLLPDQDPLRLLQDSGSLSSFINSSLMPVVQTGTDTVDPRLQRAGRTWTFSSAFRSQIGADPWALHGIGFPNIETHGPRVATQYKPFQAVLDWKQSDAKQGEWTPVPAVYCMGLSAQQIDARAAEHERQILQYAMQYGVSASLVKAVITKESCFDTKAISSAGAEGLMQLMPETARWLKVTDRNDVNQNLSAGIKYLADLRERFGSEELALAAYNAGPGNVERHGGIPPFQETQQYVKAVMEHYRRYAATTRFANERISY